MYAFEISAFTYPLGKDFDHSIVDAEVSVCEANFV